ncbi:hypothetical protein M3Y94_00568600 [Aphelenchoides besseyi]|nr:hypothetical protein M3Y94_00568600 [Aphelenchoides besseyi]
MQQVYNVCLSIWSNVLDVISLTLAFATSAVYEVYDRYVRLKYLIHECIQLGQTILGIEAAQMEIQRVGCEAAVTSDLFNRLQANELSMSSSKTDRQFVTEKIYKTKDMAKKLKAEYNEKCVGIQRMKPEIWLSLKRVMSAAATLGLIRNAPPLVSVLKAEEEKPTVYYADPLTAKKTGSTTSLKSEKKSSPLRLTQNEANETVKSEYAMG